LARKEARAARPPPSPLALFGDVSFVKGLKKKKDNVRIYVFDKPVAAFSRTCVIFVDTSRRASSSDSLFAPKENGSNALSFLLSALSPSPLL